MRERRNDHPNMATVDSICGGCSTAEQCVTTFVSKPPNGRFSRRCPVGRTVVICSSFIFTNGGEFCFKKMNSEPVRPKKSLAPMSPCLRNIGRLPSVPSHGQECTGRFVFRIETALLWTTASSKGGKRSCGALKGDDICFEHVVHGGDGDGPQAPGKRAKRMLMVVGQGKDEAVRQQKRHSGCPLSSTIRRRWKTVWQGSRVTIYSR